MDGSESITIMEHNLEDDDAGLNDIPEVENAENTLNMVEASRKCFRFSKTGEWKELEKLLVQLLSQLKHEDKARNLICHSNEYKIKLENFLNEKDKQGNAAAHYAAKGGHKEVIRILADYGANLQAKSQNNMNVLQFSAKYGEDEEKVWECIQRNIELENPTIWKPLRKGLDIAQKDDYGYNILHLAIQNEQWKYREGEEAYKGSYFIKEVIDLKEIKVGDTDLQDNTTLHLAMLYNKPEMVSFLLERSRGNPVKEKKLRECLEHKNNTGKTPLHIACQRSNKDNKSKLI